MMIVLLCNSENFKRKIYIKSSLKYLKKQVLLKTGMNKPKDMPAFFSYQDFSKATSNGGCSDIAHTSLDIF